MAIWIANYKFESYIIMFWMRRWIDVSPPSKVI